jgi:hypothetical protein
MWIKNLPREEGYYWVKAQGILSGQEFNRPVHVYKSTKELNFPDRVFFDGSNFPIGYDKFIEWWDEMIMEPGEE